MNLGEQLKKHRTQLGFTIRQMAKMLEITPAWLSRLENHHEIAMSDDTARRAIEILDLDECELFRNLGRLPRDSMDLMTSDHTLFLSVWKTIEEQKRKIRNEIRL